MKIQIEHIEKTVEEKEIELPYFSRSENGFCFHKVVNENEFIRVSGYNSPEIQRYIDSALIHDWPFEKGSVEITEEEFERAFNKVLNKIKG